MSALHLSAGCCVHPGANYRPTQSPTMQVAPGPQQMGPGVRLHQRTHIGVVVELCKGGSFKHQSPKDAPSQRDSSLSKLVQPGSCQDNLIVLLESVIYIRLKTFFCVDVV